MKKNKGQQLEAGMELDLFVPASDLLTPDQLAVHAMALEAEEAEEDNEAANLTEDVAVPAESAGAANVASAANDQNAPQRKRKKKKKKAPQPQIEAQPKNVLDQLRDFINEDEDKPIHINVRALLSGDGLPGFFRRNWAFITIIVFFTCCYVTCRYMMQSAVLEYDKLSATLIDRRYKTLTLNSELLERTLSSHIEKNLSDSTIHTPTEQAYRLHTKE